MRALLAIVLLIISSTTLAQGFNTSTAGDVFGGSSSTPEFLRVEEAYQVELVVQPDKTLRLYWQIADEYYLYQHRFAFDLTDENGAIEVSSEFPPALERTDEFFGEVSVYYREADILLTPQRATGTARLRVTSQGCADAGLCYPPHKEYFEIDFTTGTVQSTGPPTAQVTTGSAPKAQGWPTIVYMLFLAFVGGSILNLMPCVFPVLSLKMLSFARSSDQANHTHSWVYASGVVLSFVLVAAVLLSLQRAGEAIGWGFHLQSPGFVIALAYLFVAMAISLSGVVEFGSSIMGTGSQLADREGLAGSFFTGVLAVVVASPCTAPFMGTALGFAVTQPPAIALAVFAALGAGMAAPMLLLSYSSGLRAMMPKPGPWMETLKQFLAFPLYATAIWLLWVAGRQTGVNTMAVALMGALLLGMGLWFWRYNDWRRALTIACVVAAVGIASWRGMDIAPNTLESDKAMAWSEQRLNELRTAGQPVFVDVTADWCISCIANEKAVLHTDEIRDAFADSGVAYMVADWTNYDADIAAFLKRYGRNGIPFYILYSGDPAQEPVILPQLLTKATVLDALSSIADENNQVALNRNASAATL